MAAATQVLTNAFLFRRVTAFQHGLEWPLVALWDAHAPDASPLRLTEASSRALVELLLLHGSPALFDMAERARWCTAGSSGGGGALRPLPFYNVAGFALERHRPEIVAWALRCDRFKLDRPERVWSDAITRASRDGDIRMLAVLHTHVPMRTNTVRETVLRKVLHRVQHVDVMRWLADHLPAFSIPTAMVRLAAERGDLAMLEFFYERGVTSCDRFVVSHALSSRRLDVLACLLEHFSDDLGPDDALAVAIDADPKVQALALRFAAKLQVGIAGYLTQSHASVDQVQQ